MNLDRSLHLLLAPGQWEGTLLAALSSLGIEVADSTEPEAVEFDLA